MLTASRVFKGLSKSALPRQALHSLKVPIGTHRALSEMSGMGCKSVQLPLPSEPFLGEQNVYQGHCERR